MSEEKQIDNEKCKTCSYRGYSGTLGIYCNYLAIAGHRRGCEPGEECTKFTTEDVGIDPDQWTSDWLEKGYEGGVKRRPG